MPFLPGQSGNPAGRKKGVRTRKAALIESLFESEVEAVGKKTLELALGGDTAALKAILDRIYPPPRGRRIQFRIPSITGAHDVVLALNAVMRAVGNGVLTIDEGAALRCCHRDGRPSSGICRPG
jgi:hypothetical protein